MKKVYGKMAAVMAVVVMVTGVLGGCGKGSQNGEAGGKIEEAGGVIEGSGQEGSLGREEKEPGAMGRYGETEMPVPDGVEGQSFVRFISGEGGNFELYTVNRGDSGEVMDSFRYVYQDGVWEGEEDWAGKQVLKDFGLELSYVAYGMDGLYYLGGTGGDYRYHLLRLEEDGSATELLEEAFKPEEGREYGLIPPKFEVLENGNVLIYGYWEVYLYEPSGRLLYTMAKDFSGSTGDGRGFCEGEEFVTVQDEALVRYDLRNGKVLETTAFEEITGGRGDMVLFGDGAGGVYVANETGLSHVNKGGTLWEILIDGSLNHMGMRSLYLRHFFQGDKDDYYGIFTGEAGRDIQFYHYEYDPDMTAVPPSALTVYSLEDHSTVRQAVSQFQSEHPDIKVEIRTAVDNGGTVTEEMIQGLNTELLSGKGADVLILDGLPADSYIEKGVLMDLTDLIGEIEGSGEMFDNLLDGFKEEDGTFYQVPARIEFPLILGKEKAISAFSSLELMKNYEGERPLFGVSNYENLLRMIARLRYEELFAQKDGLADKDTLVRYLEAVKAIGEASGSKTSFTQEEGEKEWVSNHVTVTGMIHTSINYDAGRSDSGVDSVGSFMDLCIPAEVRSHSSETNMVPGGKIYLPSTIAGINQSTNHEEMAKEFIRCLLSYEVQKEELYDGFPVNKKALEALAEVDRGEFSVGSGSGDGSYSISANYPALEVRREVGVMMENLTVPAVVDETIMSMIVEGSRDYFDNKESVEQAADKILRKLSVYLAE